MLDGPGLETYGGYRYTLHIFSHKLKVVLIEDVKMYMKSRFQQELTGFFCIIQYRFNNEYEQRTKDILKIFVFKEIIKAVQYLLTVYYLIYAFLSHSFPYHY